jgi:hypothetical protein
VFRDRFGCAVRVRVHPLASLFQGTGALAMDYLGALLILSIPRAGAEQFSPSGRRFVR